jgi:hypothetical protein
MDLRAYYRKRREMEKELGGGFVVVKSLATPDGGIAGRLTEVTAEVAARMIVEGLAEAASPEEAAAYRRQQAEEQASEEQKRESARIQFAVVTEPELRALQQARTNPKG